MQLKFFIIITLMLSVFLLFIDREPADSKKIPIAIGSGSIHGTFYLIANNMAELINETDTTITAKALPTRGSVYNINALRQNNVQLSLTQSDIAYYAYHGMSIPSFENYPMNNLRGLAMLYPEIMHVMTRKNSTINHIDDLKGKRVFMGEIDSGSEQNALQILASYDLTLQDIEPVYGSISFGIEQLKEHRVDALFYTIGLQNTHIEKLIATTAIRFIPLQREKIAQLSEKYPFYAITEIPAKTYGGMNQTILTLAVKSMLVVDQQKSNSDVITKIMQALFNHIKKFQSIDERLENYFTLDKAVQDMPIPLHCEAVIFYQQHNISIPESLYTHC